MPVEQPERDLICSTPQRQNFSKSKLAIPPKIPLYSRPAKNALRIDLPSEVCEK